MERLLKNLTPNSSLIFIGLFFITIYGFYNSYFGLIPKFNPRITSLTHIHAILICGWFLMLVAQPVLIRYKRIQTHKFIGTISYFYIPVVLFAMVIMVKQGYASGFGHLPQTVLLAFQFIPVSATFLFGTSYLMAILNRNNRYNHKRFMIVNALILLQAAFGRINYSWLGITEMVPSVTTALTIPVFMLFALLINDVIHKRSYQAYLLSFIALVSMIFYYDFFTMGPVWQSIAKAIFE